jgi:hypothetical protein
MDKDTGSTLKKGLCIYRIWSSSNITTSLNLAGWTRIPKPRPGDRAKILLYFPEYKLSEDVEDFAHLKVKWRHPLEVNRVTSSSRAKTVMGSMIRSKIRL